MKLFGVVVAFHPKKEIIQNIKTYLYQLDKLLVIDNSEEDNSNLFTDKKIEYLHNKRNEGIAKSLNKAASLADKEGYRYILTMDQDSKFDSKSFEKYLSKIEKYKETKVAIFSPLHKTKSDVLNNNITEKSLTVMTSGNIIDIAIWKELRGFKDWLFIDGVDQEYCLNAQKNGYKIKVFNDIILEHNLGNTITKKLFNHTFIVTNHNYARRYFITRNRLYINSLYKKTFPNFCKQELEYSKKEILKILLFEKDKIKKMEYIIRAQKDFKNNVKGIPQDIQEVLK